MTVQKGQDPREFVLFAYGGGGPGHAVSIARELGIRTVVIPPYPGIFSARRHAALGCERVVQAQPHLEAPDADAESFEPFFAAMEAGRQRAYARGRLCRRATSAAQRAVEMRYAGQEFTLRLPFSDTDGDDVPDDLHRALRGAARVALRSRVRATPSEVVGMHVEVYGRLPETRDPFHRRGAAWTQCAPRRVYFEDHGFHRNEHLPARSARCRRGDRRPGDYRRSGIDDGRPSGGSFRASTSNRTS